MKKPNKKLKLQKELKSESTDRRTANERAEGSPRVKRAQDGVPKIYEDEFTFKINMWWA